MPTTFFNEFLDTYNDYMRLYEMFGDHVYMEQANEVLCHLQIMAIRNEQHQAIIWKINSPTIHAY
ncbi:hypothetical protein LOZ80_18590 [Paenibacillus sp. HWE-109]|uniref:hypothetical protein n=1 Tax=Paenibacillus sp. HWE-109 TaxID=1306526 RepID=UPI001EDE17D7|nr:hypothetical protein [Paenibacillus sp. HWE-109]UKS30834.1 hypothetical protein LOZ80_18590 [Paenibacillus sp. HWE-109]